MIRPPRDWIFVTGAPRSGTTFVGQVLARPLAVDYIHEPFNPDCGIPGVSTLFPYTERGAASEARYREAFERIRRYDFALKTAIYPRDAAGRRLIKRVLGSRGPYHLRLAKLNAFRRAALVKDPIGCLLADYAQREFGYRTIVLVRHPIAFVASYLRLGWNARTSLQALLAQPELTARFGLAPALEAALAAPADRALDAASLWRALNLVLLDMAERNEALLLIRHEDASAAPLDAFATLHEHAGIPWSAAQRAYVERQTRAGNRTEAAAGRVQDFRRDSASLLAHRLQQVDEPTRRATYDRVSDVSDRLYDRASFDI